jgi:TetR/AcrR family transcriptional repressor of nem operon
MNKISNREKILTEGLRVVHEHGFGGASVRDIVQAAGVPQGSFTNHFVSKEAFGLEVIDLYFEKTRETLAATLLNDALPPLQRISLYIDTLIGKLSKNGMRTGCLLGNFTAEATETSPVIRDRLVAVFGEIRDAVAYSLRAAVAAGELRPGFECDDVAGFIVSSMQGANLLSKAERTAEPIERFKRVLFSQVLR